MSRLPQTRELYLFKTLLIFTFLRYYLDLVQPKIKIISNRTKLNKFDQGACKETNKQTKQNKTNRYSAGDYSLEDPLISRVSL